MTVIAEDSLPLASGDLVAEKYRVGRVLGIGGMACVMAATHETLGKKVALKVMLPSLVGRPDAVERFIREGRAAAQLTSHHVCKVLDVGKLESGEPFLVLEMLEGSDLESVLEKRGALPVDDAIEIVVQTCSALAEAHERGIVHRDLKPSNLFIIPKQDGRPHVKVLDFGISKIDGASTKQARLTRKNAVMGSPAYMSPEQTRSSQDVDKRTDIWSLGVILYRMLAGREPFPGPNVAEIFAAVLEKEPAPLTDLQGYLPDGLEQIVMRCLEKDPAKRFQNVSDLAGSIAKLSSRSASFSFFPPVSESAIAIDPSPPKVYSKTVVAWDGQEGRRRSDAKRVVIAALLGCIVVGIGALAIVKRDALLAPSKTASAPAIDRTAPADTAPLDPKETTASAAAATTATAGSTATASATTTAAGNVASPLDSAAATVASVPGKTRSPTTPSRPGRPPHGASTTSRSANASAGATAAAPPPPPPPATAATTEPVVEPPRHRTSW